jgi:hypothetical protein
MSMSRRVAQVRARLRRPTRIADGIAADTRSQDEPYQESVDYVWTEKAFEMLERGDLHGEVVSRNDVVLSRVWGPCPRCGHALDDRQTHTAVTNLMGRERRRAGGTETEPPGQAISPVFHRVDVSCGCGDRHSGAPAGQTGCGVSFRVEVPIQSAGESSQS